MRISKNQNTKLLTAVGMMLATFTSMPLMAIEKGDYLIDARILNISPDVSSNQIMAGGAPLAEPSGIDIDDAYSLGVDITYMVSDNFGVELMLDTTSTHDIKGTGNLAGVNIGEVTVLPPSLIAIWHFMPANNIRPYAGAGLNYTLFLNEGTHSDLTNALGATSTGLDVDDTLSLVVQAGVDIDIYKDWYLSFDAKYIDMDTKATVQVDGADAATVEFDVNPLVLGVGVGTSF